MARMVRLVALVIGTIVAAGPVAGMQWQELHPASSPPARFGHAMALAGTDVYLFGGRPSTTGQPFADLWRWDRSAEQWMEVPRGDGPWPPARSFHSMIGLDGRLLLYGGLGASSVLGDLWLFDPQSGTWQQLQLAGPSPRQFGALADLGEGKVFLGGGFQTTGVLAMSDAWELTIGTDGTVSAARLPDLPSGMYGFLAGALTGDPLLVGGMVASSGTATPTASVQLLDRTAGTWTELVPSGVQPVAQALAAGIVAHLLPFEKKPDWGDVAILIGGKTAHKADASATVQLYDSRSNRWTALDDAPVPLASPAGAPLPPLPGDPDGLLEGLLFGGTDPSGTPLARTFLLTTDIVVTTPVEERTFWIPAAAHAAGSGGTAWRTDLEIHNRGDAGASVRIDILPWNRDNATSVSAGPFDVPADGSLRFPDVVDTLFGTSTACALRVAVAGGDALVTSRTFNDTPGGTYGQFIPAIEDGTVTSGTVRLVQLTGSADPATGFRTNIGVLNVTASPIDVVVELFDAGGLPLGSLPVTLPPYGATQLNDVFRAVGAGDVPDGWASVRTTTPDGRFVAYASVVDNRTGDPVYVPAR